MLENLKNGDLVKFRCGGEAVVRVVEDLNSYRNIKFEGDTHGGLCWLVSGKFDYSTSTTDPFDIIEVIPCEKPFDWDTVKNGMCFLHKSSQVWYIGDDFEEDDYVICSDNVRCHYTSHFEKIALTRHPEGDIK